MTGSPLDRLRRLPWWLAGWLTAITAVGTIVLAALLIQADTARGEAELDGRLGRVTAAVTRLISYDGTIVTAAVGTDEVNTGCPEFAVLPGPTERFAGHVSRRDCVPVDPGVAARLAAESVGTGRELTGYVRDANGDRARVRVEPFRNTRGQYVGAVVAMDDPAEFHAEHRRFVLLVCAGGLLFLAAVAFAGYVLADRAVRPASAALEQQEVLLADTAHDLRTPVAALRALAETALLQPDQRTELLPRAVDLARRMGTIIDGVLMRARLAAGVESLEVEPLWLDQLVSTVVEETLPGGAEITLTAAPSKVQADAGLVRRAITNLLDNALRHGRVPGQPAIVHITVAGGRVTVADHGPGIDAATAGESFERFKSSGGSSGLGLSIVRWVAQAHGGTLRVYNAEEGGAIFELELPLTA
ncbi:sensor histidine kinase [Actinoplanes friuliensis]|uniref:histidine kinase n=1 Tax=Actinoplanes friuliensis DSM 7358 TaxID=1246995 RepID=U5W444_9ACTN|nr:HAMP domain-containing sensor histidine kinase [Actinoplanes friuliensis]AGZ43904.1 histidine kinase [Actinoplanes friuliensis DSM 7358]